jgi:hypothetical protein
VAAIHDVARASLYRAPINLWVEDELTRTYLSEIWNTPEVAFLIGGGNEGVRAVVNDAKKPGFDSVFALIDGDSRPSDKADWADRRKTFRTFVLPVHEIENYVLDAPALASIRMNNLKKTATEIESMMEACASELCWWTACCDVVAELRRRFREGFVANPACDVKNETHARDICRSAWFQRLAKEVADTTEADVHKLLAESHLSATQSLSDGGWRIRFAGKQILRDVGSRICDRTGFANYQPSPTEFDQDVAKEVGAWQKQNGAVPADLVDLLSALQQRIARTPSQP